MRIRTSRAPFTRPFASAKSLAIVGLGAAALLLTGCGTDAEPAAGPPPADDAVVEEATDDGAVIGDHNFAGEELTVWFPGSDQTEMEFINNTVVPAFEEKTGADVTVTFVDWGDMSPRLNAGFAANTAPDVFGHGPAAVADFVVNDRVVDLGPYLDTLDPEHRADLADALPGGQVNGVQYLIPLSIQGHLVVYNATDFAEAGVDLDNPPTTWNELLEIADRLTERDGSGNVTRAGLLLPTQPIANQQSFANLLFAHGGDLVNADGTATAFNTEAGTAALQFLHDMYVGPNAVGNMLSEDYMNLPAAQQPLALGTASAAILNPPQAQQIFDANPDLDLRVLQPLAFDGSDTPAAFGGASAGLMINADSPHKDLAWEFISFVVSAENALAYAEAMGVVPVLASAIDADFVQESPVLTAWVQAVPEFRPNPNVPGWVQVRDIMVRNIDANLHGQVDVTEAVETMSREADEILANN